MSSSSKIENPKTPQSNKSKTSDQDILSNSLLTEINLCNSYVRAMHEASHEKYYTLVSDLFKDTSKQQRKLYDLQFQHGWNSLTPAPQSEIAALEQEFNGYKQQLQ